MDGTAIGKIRKSFHENCHYDLLFPMDMDVKLKAVILGACVFIVNKILC